MLAAMEGRPPRNRPPQEKQVLSYAKDRRNSYGENDKASRKNIPRAEARVNRANRRGDTVALAGATGVPDQTLDAAVGDAVQGRPRKVWRKVPDESLGRRLARRGGDPDPAPFDPSQKSWH